MRAWDGKLVPPDRVITQFLLANIENVVKTLQKVSQLSTAAGACLEHSLTLYMNEFIRL